jgi:hypothetical protein
MRIPACHLTDTVHTCILVEIAKIRISPGPQGKTVCRQHHTGDVDFFIHFLTSLKIKAVQALHGLELALHLFMMIP